MLMRLELEMDDCDERAEATDEGERDRGVEMSVEGDEDVLDAYDAMAGPAIDKREREAGGRGKERKSGRRGSRARITNV